MQKYYERLNKLFQRGQIQDVEQPHKFLAKLKLEIRKLCVVKTYDDIEEVVIMATKIERMLGELRDTPYEPMKEKKDEVAFGKSTMDQQLHVLNETFINFFGKRIDGKARLNTLFLTNGNCCQLCHSKEHLASMCPKLIDTRPKCGGGHKTDNCGLKCFFYFTLGHMEDRCWKKIAKGPTTTMNFLEVLINDEEATLSNLNQICGDDQHVYFSVRIPKR